LVVSVVSLRVWSASTLPWWLQWLQAPEWTRPLRRAMGQFLLQHQGAGLFSVVFLEELGVPLPIPGDVAIMTGGYLTSVGQIPYPVAYLAVIVAAVLGATALMTLSRRYGRPWLLRIGAYIGLREERLQRAEAAFRRWGPWAIIIGRLIPGMRIVLSAISGVLEVPYRIFVPSVAISSAVWAVVFIELGRHLGRRTLALFRLLPAHLIPLILLAVAVGAGILYLHEHRPKRRRATTAATGPSGTPAPSRD
jgi:membrane protein DedA with SNARE-associated domain